MARKVAILLVLTLAAAFLGFALLHAADNKAKVQTQKEVVPAQSTGLNLVRGNRADALDVEPGEGAGATLTTAPTPRFSPNLSQAASPYVLLHTGAREADNNGNWKYHVSNVAGGSVHMSFGVFDSGVVGRNNAYVYQCYNPLTGALSFPIGSEPNQPAATAGPFGQNGGLSTTPSGRSVQAMRSTLGHPTANQGTAVVFDVGACLGVLSADTVAGPDATLPLDPDIHIIDENTWVAFLGPFNLLHMSSSRTTDGGANWSPATPVIQASFLQITSAGNLDSDANPNNDTVWAAAPGCQDSACFLDYEEVLVTRSVDGGQTWLIPAISPAGSFEYPSFHVGHSGMSLTSMMVGDNYHIAWLDWADDPTSIPGGHVHHMAVKPDLSLTPGSPHQAAVINLPFTQARDLSASTGGATGVGFGWGIWYAPTMAYKADSGTLYILWSQPPSGPNGAYTDSTRGTTGASVRTYGNNDVHMVVSDNQGASWDAPENVTMTNNPGCQGPLAASPTPCQHELYISAARRADSLIYVLAQTQTLPGFQSATANDRGFPFVIAGNTTGWITKDEWRLYKVPAREPIKVASCGSGGTPNPSPVHLLPGGPSAGFTYNLDNTGLADLVLDSVTITGTLNGAQLVTDVSGANIGEAIPELDDYSFLVTFNPAGVTPSQSGLRNGNIVAWVHTTNPLATNFGQALSCQLPASVFVVPSFCLFSNDSISSGTNASRLGTTGCSGCATPGPSGFNDAMFYASTNDGYIFEAAPTWVYSDTAAHTNGPDGVRWYFADQFFRCLTSYESDTIPFATGLNISKKAIITGQQDSDMIAQVIWEQCTDPGYSDFLALTVKVTNVSGSAQPGMVLGATCDFDVPTEFNGVATPAIRFGPHNLSYPVSHVSAVDGKTYTILTSQGIDTVPGEFGDPVVPDPDGRLCSGNERFFGILCLPNGAASSSPVQATGAVAHSNRTLSTGGWDDTLFVRNMLATGYHSGASGSGDPFTGMDTFFLLDSCDAANGFPNGISTDVGSTVAAKSVNFAPNLLAAGIVSRYGMEGLAASLDTATNLGPTASYTILYVAGIADSLLWIEAVDSAISWFNQNAGQQVGGDMALWHRGDFNDDGLVNGIDHGRMLNAAFSDVWNVVPLKGYPAYCVADLNLDGFPNGIDVGLSLNYAFSGVKPAASYPDFPLLMGCF